MAELEHLKSGGATLAYHSSGPVSGPPLLLIHGITEDHRTWDELMPELSRDSRVIRIDLPGHGASSPLPEYSAPALVTPLAELVGALKLDRPHVIGHSLGGLMATLLGALVPVRSIINVDQSLRLGSFLELVRGIAPPRSGPGVVEGPDEQMELLGGAPPPQLAPARRPG